MACKEATCSKCYKEIAICESGFQDNPGYSCPFTEVTLIPCDGIK